MNYKSITSCHTFKGSILTYYMWRLLPKWCKLGLIHGWWINGGIMSIQNNIGPRMPTIPKGPVLNFNFFFFFPPYFYWYSKII